MNKRFVWTQEYSVNVAEIDEQHKEFIRICNSLLDLVESDSFTEEEALVRVGELGSYAFYHLSAEEEDFLITKYPDAQEHIIIHNIFREKAKDFDNQIRDKNKDKKIVLKEIAEFTGEWLMKHILIMDKKYTKCFNEYGLK
jgi:hemerythrin